VAVDLFTAVTLEPKEAVAFLERNGVRMPAGWLELYRDLAKMSPDVGEYIKLNVLQTTAEAVRSALKDGQTFDEFKKAILPRLERAGWSGNVVTTGGKEIVELSAPYRLELIYRTQVQSAYQAGRYKQQMQNRTQRPYLQYVAVMDSKTRPSHGALNEKVFPADDPFWDSFYPPNGFRCRCRVRSLSAQEVRDDKLEIEKSDGNITTREVDMGDRKEKLTYYTDRSTGEIMHPDAGWDRNPAKEVFAPDLDKYDERLAEEYRKRVNNG